MIDDYSDLSQQSSGKNSCIYSTIILDYDQDELLSNQINENMSFNPDKPKNKRQRLNNLTQDEKLIRRKLKNRVAAQNARDRKKAKMENSELHILKEENKSLKKENHLLKEKSKILMDENKRLTKYKEIVDSSQLSIGINENANQQDEKLCIEVVRSAASASRVSQPKKLLQTQFYQILFCILMCANFSLKSKASLVQKSAVQSSILMNPRSRLRTVILKIVNLINVIERRNIRSKMKDNNTKTKLIIIYQLLKRLMMKRMQH